MEPPVPPKPPKTMQEKEHTGRVIFVLEQAHLETVKVGREFQLLNCDDHKEVMRRAGRDFADARPDIVHQVLLTLLDSPLNKAGKLQIFIHTQKGVLIEVSPHMRIPRTYKRFAGLMVQLLHKLKIRATNGPEILLRVIKNPVTDHLPTNCRKIGTSHNAPNLVDVVEFIPTLPSDRPVVFFVGAMAHGSVDMDDMDQVISISEYPLSASVCCGRICNAFECFYDIL